MPELDETVISSTADDVLDFVVRDALMARAKRLGMDHDSYIRTLSAAVRAFWFTNWCEMYVFEAGLYQYLVCTHDERDLDEAIAGYRLMGVHALADIIDRVRPLWAVCDDSDPAIWELLEKQTTAFYHYMDGHDNPRVTLVRQNAPDFCLLPFLDRL